MMKDKQELMMALRGLAIGNLRRLAGLLSDDDFCEALEETAAHFRAQGFCVRPKEEKE